MSQDSQHGKWTISDSEDEDNIIPPTPQKDLNKPSIKPDLERKPQQEPKLSPKRNVDTHSVNQPPASFMGSEARTATHVNQTNPVEYESNPSPSVKRKRETEEAGWKLSSSDDETTTSALKNEPKKSKVSPKMKKTEDKRLPSPHGTGYKEEPADFFETNLLSLNDMYRFYLNKVTGIPKKFNTGALHIKEILSPIFGTLKESVQAKLDIAFGTHHTKIMLLWYEEGFRVIILTSNLIRADWYQKTQGMWMSPLYPRLLEGSPGTAGESPTNFKRELLEYLEAYQAPELAEWIERIKQHDLSETRVYLIGSTPGRYQGPAMEKWGHLRLRKDYPSVENVRTSLEGYPAGGSLPYIIQTAQKQLWLHSYFHGWHADVTGRSNAMPHIKTYMTSHN